MLSSCFNRKNVFLFLVLLLLFCLSLNQLHIFLKIIFFLVFIFSFQPDVVSFFYLLLTFIVTIAFTFSMTKSVCTKEDKAIAHFLNCIIFTWKLFIATHRT